MPSKRRVFRIEERVREVISARVAEMSDPRFQLITITSVTASPDARQMKVYWTCTNPQGRKEEVEEALKYAAGNFRRAVGDELNMRYTPEIRFYYDNTLDVMDEVGRLLARIK